MGSKGWPKFTAQPGPERAARTTKLTGTWATSVT